MYFEITLCILKRLEMWLFTLKHIFIHTKKMSILDDKLWAGRLHLEMEMRTMWLWSVSELRSQIFLFWFKNWEKWSKIMFFCFRWINELAGRIRCLKQKVLWFLRIFWIFFENAVVSFVFALPAWSKNKKLTSYCELPNCSVIWEALGKWEIA